MPTTEEVLAERGARYGKFLDHAEITQALKSFFHGDNLFPMRDEVSERIMTRWNMMEHDQRECLDMVAHKLGRILNGDPNYGDSWLDIGGYCTLVANRLDGAPESL